MSGEGRLRDPGEFARERYRQRARAWRKQIWWIVALVGAMQLTISIGLGLFLAPSHLQFYAGLGIGASASIAMFFLDTPPQRIESWRRGAQGEQATAKALRRLTRDGWTVVHDIQTDRGNIDHVIVGPPGVFLLETKDLAGTASVTDGVLAISYPEDPDDGYELPHLARRVRGQAAALAAQLRNTTNSRVWVQPVVVLWTRFEQGSVVSANVGWVAGKRLANVLERRAEALSAVEVEHLACQLRGIAVAAAASPLSRKQGLAAEAAPGGVE